MKDWVVGCPQCNAAIAEAERTMQDKINYVGIVEYSAYHKPLPTPFLDGESFAGRSVVAVVLGPDGMLLANHQDPAITFHNKTHLCHCGSEQVARVLYRGHVEFRVVSPIVAP